MGFRDGIDHMFGKILLKRKSQTIISSCFFDLDFKFRDCYGRGWWLVKLADVYSRASYITDVPYNCLKSSIDAIK